MKIKDIESEYLDVTVFSWFTEEFFKGWNCILVPLIKLLQILLYWEEERAMDELDKDLKCVSVLSDSGRLGRSIKLREPRVTYLEKENGGQDVHATA